MQNPSALYFSGFVEIRPNIAYVDKSEAFGGNADAPAGARVPQNPETAARIMHARLQVGDRLFMGADAPPQFATGQEGLSHDF
jgi:hypothetical protein